MDRSDQITKVAAVFFQKQTEINRHQMNTIISAHSQELLDDFSQAISRLVIHAQHLQKVSEKKAIKYFSVAYLRSSIITKTYEFQFSLMDKQYFADPIECCEYWGTNLLTSHIEAEYATFLTAMKKNVVQLHAYEVDELWQAHILKDYNKVMKPFFTKHIKNVAEAAEIGKLSLADEVLFVFGGYMDRCVRLDIRRLS